jgi:putative phosphoribosyl transferase
LTSRTLPERRTNDDNLEQAMPSLMTCEQVEITVAADERVVGHLVIPASATGAVVFAHGSGSSRHSRRNRRVAAALNERRLATLLMDLLTEREDAIDQRTRQLRFDIGLLAQRLLLAASTLAERTDTGNLPVGYFGASTGGGAALVAARREPDRVRAVVSRGGRPDLAADDLPAVHAPTLLIVGGRDPVVLDLNRRALDLMRCERRLDIVPGATHLFEEPGALTTVGELACEWFVKHL